MTPELALLALLALGLLIATIRDLQEREVPDLVSLGLLTAGLLGWLAVALIEQDPLRFYPAATGAIIGFSLGWLMYRARQWGGGDAKLLAGVGAIIGLWTPEYRLLTYVLLLAIGGAAYGVLYTAWLIAKHRRTFTRALLARLREPAVHRTRLVLVVCAAIAVIAIIVVPSYGIKLAIALAILGAYLMLYTWLVSRTLETVALTKTLAVTKLVEGDWIVADVRKGKKVLVPARNTGVTLADMRALKRAKVKTVIVREGIPFVPAFLIALLLLVALESQGIGIGLLVG